MSLNNFIFPGVTQISCNILSWYAWIFSGLLWTILKRNKSLKNLLSSCFICVEWPSVSLKLRLFFSWTENPPLSVAEILLACSDNTTTAFLSNRLQQAATGCNRDPCVSLSLFFQISSAYYIFVLLIIMYHSCVVTYNKLSMSLTVSSVRYATLNKSVRP